MSSDCYPFWVTRNRHPDAEQLPHPDGFDEWLDGKPTGRIRKMVPPHLVELCGRTILGTVDEIDEWLSTAPTETLMEGAKLLKQLTGDRQAKEKAAADAREVVRIKHSGLTRNRKEEDRLRDMIEKFQAGGSLSDLELRFLIQYYGLMIRMCEMSGQRYYLAREDAWNKHQILLKLADLRGWTQAIINMYGVMVEGHFEKIC